MALEMQSKRFFHCPNLDGKACHYRLCPHYRQLVRFYPLEA